MDLIHAHILSPDYEVKDGFVKIQDGKIQETGDMANYFSKSDEPVDLKGQYLLPGWIDAHCHIGLFGNGGGSENEDGNETGKIITPGVRAIDGINPQDRCFGEARAYGITTVVVSPGSANPINGQIAALKTWGTIVDEMVLSAEVGMKMALGENPKKVHGSKGQEPTSRMGTASIIRETLKKAQKYSENKGSENYSVDYEILESILYKGIPVHFHAHRADDIATAIRISKEFALNCVIVHGTDSQNSLDQLEKEKASVILGPLFMDRGKPELLGLSMDTPAVLEKKGILFAICTDHPENPISELLTVALIARREGLSEMGALKALTINPAKICGIDHRVGSIEKGKDANLQLYKNNPFTYLLKPEWVMGEGNVFCQ